MASYLELYNLLENFTNRTVIAVLKIADYILTVEGSGVSNHANRVIWAGQAMTDPLPKAKQLLWSVLANGDVQSQGEAVADSVVQYVVEVNLDKYATGS